MFTHSLIQNSKRGVHKYQKVLNSLSHNVLSAEYAVRGQIPLRGADIAADLKANPGNYAYTETTALNIGNPQQVG